MWRAVFAVGAALTFGVVVLPVSAHAATVTKTALLYGDSLSFESTWAIRPAAGWTDIPIEYPGTAPCDWTSELVRDLATDHPSVVGVEFAGNVTRPCMLDADGNQLVQGSDAFYAKYRADLTTFAAAVTETGARFVFIVPPPMLNATWNSAIIGLEGVERDIAAAYPGVSVTVGPRNAVSANGTYEATKPCLGTETAAMGCTDGRIEIRTDVGSQTGVHFCPTGLDSGYPYRCDEYSSGEKRFGSAISGALARPPAPIRPAVTMVKVTGTEGSTFSFRPTLGVPYSSDFPLCYSTIDGTATVSAGDYTAASGCFVIPAGSTTGPAITVSTLLDHVHEANEAFKVKVWGRLLPITGNAKIVTATIKSNTT
jgi:hypothetical protein